MMTQLLIGLLMWAAMTGSALAVDRVKPLKAKDYIVRNRYPFELLEEVLKRTAPEWGPYVEEPFTEPISVARAHQEALKGDVDRKSTRLNSSHITISYAVFCL